MNSLNVEQIQEIIPHRHPFLLIDKIEDYVPGEYAIGYKGVSYHAPKQTSAVSFPALFSTAFLKILAMHLAYHRLPINSQKIL